jgi:hypothetical protein
LRKLLLGAIIGVLSLAGATGIALSSAAAGGVPSPSPSSVPPDVVVLTGTCWALPDLEAAYHTSVSNYQLNGPPAGVWAGSAGWQPAGMFGSELYRFECIITIGPAPVPTPPIAPTTTAPPVATTLPVTSTTEVSPAPPIHHEPYPCAYGRYCQPPHHHPAPPIVTTTTTVAPTTTTTEAPTTTTTVAPTTTTTAPAEGPCNGIDDCHVVCNNLDGTDDCNLCIGNDSCDVIACPLGETLIADGDCVPVPTPPIATTTTAPAPPVTTCVNRPRVAICTLPPTPTTLPVTSTTEAPTTTSTEETTTTGVPRSVPCGKTAEWCQ